MRYKESKGDNRKIVWSLILIDLLIFSLDATIIYFADPPLFFIDSLPSFIDFYFLFLKNSTISILNFLNKNSGAIQTISTVILVIITGIAMKLTEKTVKIMKESEEKRNRPRVILYLQQRENWLNFVDLFIGNYGLSIARDIRFSLNEDLRLLRHAETISNIGIIKHGIKYLVPKQVLKIPLLSLAGRINELNKKNIEISVTYRENAGTKTFSEKFQLDFKALIEHQIGKSPIYEVSENIKKIWESLGKINENLKKRKP